MAIESNRPLYQRLVERCTSRTSLENPSLSLQHVFTQIDFFLNNNDVIIILPPDVYDVDRIEKIDAYDKYWIRIATDC